MFLFAASLFIQVQGGRFYHKVGLMKNSRFLHEIVVTGDLMDRSNIVVVYFIHKWNLKWLLFANRNFFIIMRLLIDDLWAISLLVKTEFCMQGCCLLFDQRHNSGIVLCHYVIRMLDVMNLIVCLYYFSPVQPVTRTLERTGNAWVRTWFHDWVQCICTLIFILSWVGFA